MSAADAVATLRTTTAVRERAVQLLSRARHGESKTVSRTSLEGPSPSRRGGLHSHTGAQGRTRDQLYREAAARGVKGRSKMSKEELQAAVGA